MSKKNFTLQEENSLALITFDAPNKNVNILSSDALMELSSIVMELEKKKDIKCVIIRSNKDNNFIAGADVNEFKDVKKKQEAYSKIREAQNVFNKIENSKKTYIASIHGTCLGGGLELALACDYRICTNSPKTSFSFPEVNLGILPAAGGTQRLPRLVGFVRSLDIVLAAKKVMAKKAKKINLIDELIDEPTELSDYTKRFANSMKGKKKRLKKLHYHHLVPLYIAKRKTLKKTKGHYPAPLAIIEALKTGVLKGMKEGLKKEAQLFSKLIVTDVAQNLIRLFFLQQSRKKSPYKDKTDINDISIVGSGLMGGGIAYVSLLSGMNVHLHDKDEDALKKSKDFIAKEIKKRVKKHKLDYLKAKRLESNLSVSTDFKHIDTSQVVIEAIFEDSKAKKKLFKDVEEKINADCIIASNTSSIPITDLSSNSKNKDRYVGLHYFSPVQKVPLLEIITTQHTNKDTLKKAFALGEAQKKVMILVNDGAGFYTTRVISALFDEAISLILEGYEFLEIDKKLKGLGYPMGPLGLMDDIGLDVGYHVCKILKDHYEERLISSDLSFLKQVIDKGHKGRKSKSGFYTYNDHRGKVNKEILALLKPYITKKPNVDVPIEQRMLLRMVNEAAYCLSEDIITSEEDGDIGAVFGIGFPPYLGGPFKYIEEKTKNKIKATLIELQNSLGKRFTKAPYFDDEQNDN